MLRDALLTHLARRPSTAVAACRQLAISQSRFSRLVAAMPNEVLRIGRARATRYVRRRPWPTLGTSQRLYEVDAAGSVRVAAVLPGAGQRGIWIEPHVDVPGGGAFRPAGRGGPSRRALPLRARL